MIDTGGFCPSCNQYGCHLLTCQCFTFNGRAATAWEAKYHQARSDYECMMIENLSLASELRAQKAAHAAELQRLLKRITLMEDLVHGRIRPVDINDVLEDD